MKAISLLLALILFFSPVVLAQAPTPYICVFVSADRAHRYKPDIINHHIDLIQEAKDWRAFDPFLRKVKEQAAGRQIVLDLCAHGDSVVPVLLVGDERHSYIATESAIINHLEAILGDNIVLLQETCYGGQVFYGSINPYPELLGIRGAKNLIEGRTKGAPAFKVLGVINYSNPIPCTLEQYLHDNMETVVDLRQFHGRAPERLTKDEQQLRTDINYLLLMRFHLIDGINKI